MISFVVSFNYGNMVIYDLINLGVCIFDYEILYCFIMILGYIIELFDGYSICFNLFSEMYKGLFYSYIYNGSDKVWGDSNLNCSC